MFADGTTIVSSKRKKFCSIHSDMASLDFEIQDKLPMRITPTSKSCIDHKITQDVVCTETLPTTISDQFTVLLHFTEERFLR